MARRIFATQRNESGSAIFAQQVEALTTNISAALSSESYASASIVFVPQTFSALIQSNSALSAKLELIDVRMAASLSSQGSLSATLRMMTTNLSAALESSSSVSAAIKIVDPVVLAATLSGSASVKAKLFFVGGSSIPKSAKLRAIPVESDSTQILRYRGDTYADQFVVIEDKTGMPVNLVGCVLKLSIAESSCGGVGEPLYTLYGTFDNIAEGEVSFAPSEEQADRVGFYKYDVELDDGKGAVRTLIKNSYVYLQDITP